MQIIKKSHKKLKKFNLSLMNLKNYLNMQKKINFSTPLDLLSAESLNNIQNIFKVASSIIFLI